MTDRSNDWSQRQRRAVRAGTGHLLLCRRRQRLAMRFDPNRREVKARASSFRTGVSRAGGSFTGAANFSVSRRRHVRLRARSARASQPLMDDRA